MPIVSSLYNLESVQADGRTACVELHTDSLGVLHRVEYLAAIEADYAGALSARALLIGAQLKADELFAAVFVLPWNTVLVEATNADLANYMRLIYRNGSREQLAQTAGRILEWIANGRFSDVQVQTVFGLTAGQWTTLKAQMQTLVNNYNAVIAAVGI